MNEIPQPPILWTPMDAYPRRDGTTPGPAASTGEIDPPASTGEITLPTGIREIDAPARRGEIATPVRHGEVATRVGDGDDRPPPRGWAGPPRRQDRSGQPGRQDGFGQPGRQDGFGQPGRQDGFGQPRRPLPERIGSVEALAAVLVLLVVFRVPLGKAISSPPLQTWTTVFVSVLVQAMPFLVFGVMLSAVIAVFVPRSFWTRALPDHPALAVPVASAAGAVLPGCECGSVPVAGSLIRRGVPPPAALAFLLGAPAINPIVLVATAVAFPNDPEMVLGRGLASLVVAMVMGWLWLRLGRTEWIRLPRGPMPHGASRSVAFWAAIRHDVVHAGGFLVLGAMAAATVNVAVPEQWLLALAGHAWLSVPVLALLAVLLSICSEADAFVAASLSEFSLTSRLVFLVVGPVVDLKLIAMQSGVFGRRFAVRFAPATFVVAVLVAAAVGGAVL